ncbi:MAG: radical SAM protein [Deltaproteobacteria bacterium]|nr:radical SAM protein [Deltaproteobacteria bacterium]
MQNKERVIFHSFDLEFTNVCNNGCSICPREKITREKGFMNFETLRLFAGELKQYNPLVTISGLGDPLLHAEFCNFIQYLKGLKFNIGVVVNIASLIKNTHNLKQITEASPHSITISVPSLEPETLGIIYNGKINQTDITETMREIAEKVKNKSRIRVSAIITDKGENTTHYRKTFELLNIPVWFTEIHSRGGNLTESCLFKRRKITKNSGCSLFLFHTFIAHNGDVLSCCHDTSGETVLGHIRDGAEKIVREKQEKTRRLPFFPLCNVCDEPLRDIRLPENFHLLPRKSLFKKLSIYKSQI